jgi:hypothetical protein
MSILVRICTAMSVADLPPVCRTFWEDDEEFQEAFGLNDDDTKADYVMTTIRKCLELSIKDDTNIARMMMYVIKNEEGDYEDIEPEEVAEVTVPTVSVPAPVAPAPVAAPVRTPVEPPAKKPRTRPDPNAPKKPRGRPPKYPNATGFKCEMCDIGCASSGSLYNHYHSKPHKDHLLTFLRNATHIVQEKPDVHYKVIVETRNKKAGAEMGLTQEYPDAGTFADLMDYVRDNDNSITYLGLASAMERVYPSGRPYISWNKVLVDYKNGDPVP